MTLGSQLGQIVEDNKNNIFSCTFKHKDWNKKPNTPAQCAAYFWSKLVKKRKKKDMNQPKLHKPHESERYIAKSYITMFIIRIYQ